jgi:hypothetical protein
MNPPGLGEAGLRIIGHGEAQQPEPNLFEARLRAVVRYADPASWIVAAAVARAVEPLKETLADLRDRVGVVVVGEEGPQEAMQAIDDAARTGFSSPLRFPAANPGAVVGVTCILLGFRGPTMNFIMPRAEGVPVGWLLAARWLERQVVNYAVITTYSRRDGSAVGARSLLLSTAETDRDGFSPSPGIDMNWLVANDA